MNRLMRSILVVVLLLSGSPADAAYTLLTHGAAGGLGTTPVTVTLDTTGADFIAVGVSLYNQDQTHVAITDLVGGNNNGAPTKKTCKDIQVNGHACIYYWKAPANVGASHAITITGDQTGAHGQTIFVSSWSGSNTTEPFDQENGATGAASTSFATGSITPSVDNTLVLTVMSEYGGTAPFSATGYTTLDTIGSPSSPSGGAAYVIQTTATATNPTWVVAVAVENEAAVVASFKAAAGGASAVSNPTIILAGP